MEKRDLEKIYMVIDESDEFCLPLGCFRTLSQAASFCGVSYYDLWYCLHNNLLVKDIMSVCVVYA